MPDPEEIPEAERSLIRKVRAKMDSKVVEAIVRWAVIAILGGGAGMATHMTGDAGESAQHAADSATIKELKQELSDLREGLKQRIEVEMRERLAAEAAYRERLATIEAEQRHRGVGR